ncbi:MAG: FKBP-type peptidyl-prolyl cis-trans isomerase [Candidatus Methanoperedens sp.]|nr:FKBP-type peptidyl-prolyl cis-trans isomerase [Candidatus Methanoperedens sp.]
MKKILILFLAALILFSGCVGQKTVKTGDNISVDYTGSFLDGKVFDTSLENMAKENQLFDPQREYKPLQFTVGKMEVIKGMDAGVIGMKVGDSKTLTILPENAYGMSNPEMIEAYPIIQVVPTVFPRIIEVPINQFEATFVPEHKKGDVVTIPNSKMNLTIVNITSNVTLSYNFKIEEQIPSDAPWNQTVVKIDDKNITVAYSVKKDEIIQFDNVPWTTTVIDVNKQNMTLRHNAVPDTNIQTMFGTLIKVHFNETSIIMDQNHELAGKTLIFNITLKSIDK